MRRTILAAVLAALAAMAVAMPASATVHEITGMLCAGDNAKLFPPGVSGGSNSGNFGRPLFATGFVEEVVAPYAGDGVNGPGVLIVFDFDHPASKLSPHPTLDTFFVGDGTYISAFVLDEGHGFTNCVRLRGG